MLLTRDITARASYRPSQEAVAPRILVSILLVTTFAVAGCRRGQGAQPSTDPDLSVLQQLEQAGSDLSKPHSPEFFLYFPSKESALEAARRLKAEGYVVKGEPSVADDGTWLCLATKSLLLKYESIVAIRARLDTLATDLGGEYDGWGTPVVKAGQEMP